MWSAWANARMLGNASGSPELTVVCSAIGKKVEWVARLEIGILYHLLALAKPTDGRREAVKAVRRLGSRGSKCVQGKDGEGRRWQELQAAGQRLQGEREDRRRGGDVVLGK